MRKRLGRNLSFSRQKSLLKHYFYVAPAKIAAYFRVVSNLGSGTQAGSSIFKKTSEELPKK
jgi:hypothetical protein